MGSSCINLYWQNLSLPSLNIHGSPDAMLEVQLDSRNTNKAELRVCLQNGRPVELDDPITATASTKKRRKSDMGSSCINFLLAEIDSAQPQTVFLNKTPKQNRRFQNQEFSSEDNVAVFRFGLKQAVACQRAWHHWREHSGNRAPTKKPSARVANPA